MFLSLQWFVKYLHPFKHETVIDTWYFVCYLCICMIFVKDTLHGICMIFAGACSYWYSPPQWTPLTSLLGRNSLIPPGPSISYPLVLEDPSNAQPVCFPYFKDPLYDAWCRPVVPSYPPVLSNYQTPGCPVFFKLILMHQMSIAHSLHFPFLLQYI